MKTTKISTILVLLLGLMICQAKVKGAIDGSGTANHIPKFTDLNTLGDSIIYEDSGNVGIGTTDPGTKLHVESGGAKTIFGKNTASGGIGVEGQARNLSGGGVGVYGQSYSTNGVGVFGIAAMSTGKNYGVYGQSQSPDGWAGYFDGRGCFSGNVGIGTTNPHDGKLVIANNATDEAYISLQPGGTALNDFMGLRVSESGNNTTKLHLGREFTSDTLFLDLVTLDGANGNVGIGTANPAEKLHVFGGWIMTGDSAGLHCKMGSNNIAFNRNYRSYISQLGHGSLVFTTSGGSENPRMTIGPNGNVGIGKTSPETKLHIDGGNDASLSGGGFLVTGSKSSTNMVIDDNEIIARNNGNPSKLYLNKGSGNVVVSVLEITGGSDLAEPFEVAGAECIEPGMVVAIDPEHPGQLRIADKAYDRTVAGIVSGANGINPGMTMSQKETVADGFLLVALTGRVYAWADASNGLIEPGDLLTTSETPGHAMKVTDYSKAHGAILGKAMSSLKDGQGLVLVLVTLQ